MQIEKTHLQPSSLYKNERPDPQTGDTSADARNTGKTAQQAEHQRGVIRNLQNGHYKGVADLRLRINFHDEIMELEKATLASQVARELPPLQDSLEGLFAVFGGGMELTAEQKAGFDELAASFSQRLDVLQRNGIDSLLADLQNAHTEFKDGLAALFASAEQALAQEPMPATDGSPLETGAATEGETGETVATVPEQTPTPSLPAEVSSWLSTLDKIFANTLGALQKSFSASILPELQPAPGNGRAYDKFLTIYTNIMAAGTPPPAEDDPLKIVS